MSYSPADEYFLCGGYAMDNGHDIVVRSDSRPPAPLAVVGDADGRAPFGAAFATIRRMRGGQTVNCVARRVESSLSRTIADKAARCYRACSQLLTADHRASLSVRA